MAVFVVGIFVGFRVLPSLFPVPAASAQQLEALEESTGILQRQIQHAVTALDNVESADAQLTLTLDGKSRRKGKAVIVPHFRSEPTAEQIDGLAILVAGLVDGLDSGDVTLIDGSGRHLNKKALVAQERKIFWTGIAINVAKILGILAALITMRFIIQTVGTRRDPSKDPQGDCHCPSSHPCR